MARASNYLEGSDLDKLGETIALATKQYADKLRESGFQHANALAFGRAVEQFAVALTWGIIHPGVQPPHGPRDD